MKFFVIFTAILFPLIMETNAVVAQTTNQRVVLNVTDFKKRKDSIAFKLSIKNISTGNVAIFKPNIEYVNYGLIAICLINRSNSDRFYFNHGRRGDIDNIILNQEDFIVLGEKESYTKEFNLPIDEFIPKVYAGNYKIEVILDYSIVNFTFPFEIKAQVFKGKVSSTLDKKE